MAEKLFGTKSELLVLGVEPKDYVTWNIGLSDDVQGRGSPNSSRWRGRKSGNG